MVKTAVLLALLAGLNPVVSVTRISSLAEVVTCMETTTGNAFANPSWESGTSGWEYNCTFLRRSQHWRGLSHRPSYVLSLTSFAYE